MTIGFMTDCRTEYRKRYISNARYTVLLFNLKIYRSSLVKVNSYIYVTVDLYCCAGIYQSLLFLLYFRIVWYIMEKINEEGFYYADI